MWTVGNGPTVVAVHGGPGFDHTYMVPALRPLAAHFRLVFYDQRRRGAITPEALTEQLRKILTAADGPPIVLAHSWGTYLAIACLASPAAPPVRGAMLVSPMPLTLTRFNQAAARFDDVLPRPAPTGMKALLPYYLARRNRGSRSIPVPDIDPTAYRKLTAALQASDYDLRQAWPTLPDRTSLVFGRQDRLSKPADFEGLRRRVKITSIAGAAHFAFAEQPEAFRDLFVRTFA